MSKFGGPPMGASSPKSASVKPQDQDPEMAGMGKYGLYRALLREKTPKAKLLNPVGEKISPVNFFKKGEAL